MKKINNWLLLLSGLVLFFSFASTPVLSALSPEQKKLYNQNVLYYDLETCVESGGSVLLKGNNNSEKIWNFFIEQGFTPEQAAGFLGNFHVETGGTFDPGIEQVGGNAFGIAQWDDRRITLEAYAREKGQPVDSLELQLDFVMHELRGSESAAYESIKATKTVEEAWKAVSYNYERPAEPANPERGKWAQVYFEKFSGNAVPSSGNEEPGTCPTRSASGGGAFSGSPQEAAKFLLSQKDVTFFDDRDMIEAVADGRESPLADKLILLLAGLAQNHTFGVSSLYRGPCSGSNHCTGNAADINPTIDGETISYTGHSSKIQAFIDDAAQIMNGDCENGVPNQTYVDKTRSGGSKCEVFVDEGTGPHVHLAVSS